MEAKLWYLLKMQAVSRQASQLHLVARDMPHVLLQVHHSRRLKLHNSREVSMRDNLLEQEATMFRFVRGLEIVHKLVRMIRDRGI